MKNLCIAHRGWSSAAPENTLTAITKALDHPKIDMVELDVQLSKDGVPVVIHDYSLARTTDGVGFVWDRTWSELKKLDAGSWFTEDFAGETIPTLEEVLDLVSHKGKKINIEIKKPADHYQGIEQRVLDLISRFGLESSVMLTSFNHESIKEVNRLAPRIKHGLIIYGLPNLLEIQLNYIGAGCLSIAYGYLSRPLALSLIEKGIELIAWTIDEPAQMQKTAAIHEDIAICTNHPERWLNLNL